MENARRIAGNDIAFFGLALRAHGISLRELEYRGVRAGVIWQDGEDFNAPASIRMNLALPKSLLVEDMSRLKNYAFL